MAGISDVRLHDLLQASGIPYVPTDDGGAEIIVPIEDGRTQRVLVEAETTVWGDMELRNVFSCAYMSRDDLPRRVVDTLLSQNREVPFGAWATFQDGGELFLVFEAKLPVTISPATFRDAIQAVAQTTDQMESTLSTDDDL